MTDVFRVYESSECGADGYPFEWHATIKHLVRELAGDRCVRCHHPYKCGTHDSGEWSDCDQECRHGGPARYLLDDGEWAPPEMPDVDGLRLLLPLRPIQAQWRILTVHHLDGDKANCRWWNLAALCQRCHLTIQGRVVLARIWPWEHSEWFQPYVAGWYAHAYLGEELTRKEAEARLEELLALERIA